RPPGGVAGVALSPGFRVQILDKYDNFVPDAAFTITAFLAESGPTLSGTLSTEVKDGIGLFTNLIVDKAGFPYHLNTTTDFPGVVGEGSGSFRISGGPPVAIGSGQQPTNTSF